MWKVVLLVLFAGLPRLGARKHGYSLSFQGTGAVAGLRNGWFDFENDPEIKRLGHSTKFTICAWIKYSKGHLYGPAFSMSPGLQDFNFVETTWYAAENETSGIHFGSLFMHPDKQMPKLGDWNHYALVVDRGTFSSYLNGTLINQLPFHAWGFMPEGPINFISGFPQKTLVLGGRMMVFPNLERYTASSGISRYRYDGLSFFNGKMDDFSIYASALSGHQVREALRYPVNKSDIPPDLVIHYNFDVAGCSMDDAKYSLYHPSCGITGNSVVANLGTAGGRYDLILGQLNEDPEYGQYWVHAFNPKQDRKHRFSKPTIGVEGSPASSLTETDDLQIPTVIQVLFEEYVEIQLPKGFVAQAVRSLPGVGTLYSNSTKVLQVGDSIEGQTFLVYRAPSAELFTDPVLFIVSFVGETTQHEVHIWPYYTPEISPTTTEAFDGRRFEIELVGREVLYFRGKLFGFSQTGEDLDLRIVRASSRAINLLEVDFEFAWHREEQYPFLKFRESKIDIENNLIPGNHAQELFGPFPVGFYGKFELTIEYVSSVSGLSSRSMAVATTVSLVDGLPNVSHGIVVQVDEDDKEGVLIEASAVDAEERFGVFLTVTELPRKGKLFKWEDDKWAMITKPFNAFEMGKPFSQFPTRVVNVSSFPSARPDLVGHPIAVTGPPFSKPVGEFGPGEVPLGYIVLVNVYSHDSPLQKPGRLTEMDMYGRVVRVYPGKYYVDIEVFPLYKYVDGTPVQCVPADLMSVNNTFDCVVHEELDGPFVVSKVETKWLRTQGPLFWVPFGTYGRVDGGELSGAFGEEFRFTHDATELYESGAVPAYTEYIEVEYDTAVFPVMIHLGFLVGSAGAVVQVSAENPEGKWVSLYEGAFDSAKVEHSYKTIQPYVFNERLCLQNFRAAKYRIHFDTSIESGTGNMLHMKLEYIKLYGSLNQQEAMLNYNENALKYIPDQDQYGQDLFFIQATDCVGDVLRNSDESVVKVQIEPVNDVPTLRLPGSIVVECDETNMSGSVSLPIIAIDADMDQVGFNIPMLPGYGNISYNSTAISPLQTLNGKQENGTTTFELVYHAGSICSEHGLQEAYDYFNVSVSDQNSESKNHLGSTKTQVIRIIRHDRKLPQTSVQIANALFTLNMVCCVICFIWVTAYRKHIVVQAAQINFLYVVIVGAALSSSTILALTVNDGTAGGAKAFADFSCTLIPWLYTMGFMTTFVPLCAKLHKVNKMFDVSFALKFSRASTEERKKLQYKLSFKGLMKRLAFVWLVEICIVLAWTLHDPLKFERVTIRRDQVITDFVLKSAGSCTSRTAYTFVGLISVYHVVILSNVAYYCYKTSDINSAFSEAKYLKICIASSLQILLFSIPTLLVSSQEPDPESSLFIRAGVVWINDFTVLAFIFVPKMSMVIHGIQKGGEGYDQLQSTIKAKESKTWSNKTPQITPLQARRYVDSTESVLHEIKHHVKAQPQRSLGGFHEI